MDPLPQRLVTSNRGRRKGQLIRYAWHAKHLEDGNGGMGVEGWKWGDGMEGWEWGDGSERTRIGG
jgi:hypothetical protein